MQTCQTHHTNPEGLFIEPAKQKEHKEALHFLN